MLKSGEIQQMGSPVDIYNEPQNAFVADFIGESNIIDGIMKQDLLVNFSGKDFICVDKGFSDNEPVDVVIRPEDIKIVENDKNAMLFGTVESVIFKGVHYEMKIKSDTFVWTVHSTAMAPVGKSVGLNIFPDEIHIMRKAEK